MVDINEDEVNREAERLQSFSLEERVVTGLREEEEEEEERGLTPSAGRMVSILNIVSKEDVLLHSLPLYTMSVNGGASWTGENDLTKPPS